MDPITLTLIITAVVVSPLFIGAFACWVEKRQKDKRQDKLERQQALAAFRLSGKSAPGTFVINLQACQLGNSLNSFKGQLSQRIQLSDHSQPDSQRQQVDFQGVIPCQQFNADERVGSKGSLSLDREPSSQLKTQQPVSSLKKQPSSQKVTQKVQFRAHNESLELNSRNLQSAGKYKSEEVENCQLFGPVDRSKSSICSSVKNQSHQQSGNEPVAIIEALASIVTEDANEDEVTPHYRRNAVEKNLKVESAFKQRMKDDDQFITRGFKNRSQRSFQDHQEQVALYSPQ